MAERDPQSRTSDRRAVAAYLRVSRIGGRSGDSYVSPDQQRDRLRLLASTLGVEIPADAWHFDQDYSGGNLERPEFHAAIERIEAGELSGLLVARIDRFSRSVTDGATQIDRILAAGGVFASAAESIDVREPVGRFVLISMLNNAELQLGLLKSGWRDAKARAVARGAHIGPTPFGYQRTPKGSPDSGRLVPDPDRSAAVAELFARADRLAAAGQLVWTGLAEWLDSQAPRRVPWTVTDVKRILRSRVYLGEVAYRDRTGAGEDLLNPAAHQPLVDAALFDRVQRLLTPGEQRVAHGSFLLSGFLRCAHCRRAMGGFSYGGADRATPVYRCIARRKGQCPGRPVILAGPLEAYVRDLVAAGLRDAGRAGVVAEAGDTGEGARLEADADRARAELERYMADTEIRDLVGDQAWRAGAHARQQALDRAGEALREWERSRPARAAEKRPVEVWTDQDYRDFLRGSVQAVFIRKVPGRRRPPVADRVLVVTHADPPIEVTGKGRRVGPLGPIQWPDPQPEPGSPRGGQ